MNRRLDIRYVASTYSFLWRTGLTEAIEELAGAGFDSVEILAAAPHVPLPMEPSETHSLRRVCSRAGIVVNSVVPSGVDVNLASTDKAMREWSVDQFAAASRVAAELSAPFVIVHPGRRHPLRPPPIDTLRRWVVDGISQVIEVAAAEGVRVLLENTPTGLLDTADDCVGVVEEVGSDRLGLCYDVANGHQVEDVVDGLRVASAYLSLVHVSDTTRSAWAHDPIGDGELAFVQIWDTLSELGYAGPVVIETLQSDDTAKGFLRDLARLRAAGWG